MDHMDKRIRVGKLLERKHAHGIEHILSLNTHFHDRPGLD